MQSLFLKTSSLCLCVCVCKMCLVKVVCTSSCIHSFACAPSVAGIYISILIWQVSSWIMAPTLLARRKNLKQQQVENVENAISLLLLFFLPLSHAVSHSVPDRIWQWPRLAELWKIWQVPLSLSHFVLL